MKNHLIFNLFLAFFLIFFCQLLIAQKSGFVSAQNGNFMLGGKEHRFVGVNYWCAAILGMAHPPGDRKRLEKELDFLAKNGVSNIRVLVSSEGDSSYPYRIYPSYQKTQGNFDESFLEGLDFLLQQCGKRNLRAVLYFTNNWEWSGGFGQYLEWNGYGKPPMAKTPDDDWEKYCDYIAQFYSCRPCITEVNSLITKVVSRKNILTGLRYKDDPSIFAWELANEPRPMRPGANASYQNWVESTSQLVKKLDNNHLLTIGCEGDVAFGWDMKPYEIAHALPYVDYLTIHIWPKNWKWFPDTTIAASMSTILEKSQAFLDRHQAIAQKLKKPLVLEEFGLPRDCHQYSRGSTVVSRNRYFNWAFDQMRQSQKTRKPLSGVCFWAFGGLSSFPAKGQFWKPGEPYTGDPPFEEQGLNSVFGADKTTWQLVRKQSGK